MENSKCTDYLTVYKGLKKSLLFEKYSMLILYMVKL